MVARSSIASVAARRQRPASPCEQEAESPEHGRGGGIAAVPVDVLLMTVGSCLMAVSLVALWLAPA